MPTYSVTSPSGQNLDVDAPSLDHANQFVAQRFFSGLEQPPNAASNSPTSGTHFYQQPSLAQQIAAKRTGDPNAVPTTADIMQAANLRTNAEAEASSSAEMQRDALRQHQRDQARLNSVWEEDDPPADMLLQEPDAPQSQTLPQQPNRGPQRPWWLSPQRAALLQRLRQVRR